MKTKWLAFGIILLFVGTCIIPATAQTAENPLSTSQGIWLFVGGNGPGNYTKIQDAIDNSSDGDTIYVFDDSSPYIENIKVYNEIHLIGENKETTELRGFNTNDKVIAITTADYVTISGFTIITETSNIGIQVYSSGNTISGNIFTDNDSSSDTSEIGILLISTSLSCTIEDNIFQNTSKGIDMEDSSFNTIRNNSFDTCYFGIISFYGQGHTIDHNTLMNGATGMLLSRCNASTISNNIISSYDWQGILMGTHSSYNHIFRNTISGCGEGITIELLADANEIQNNTVVQNTDGIVISSSCDYTCIENNEILQNENYGIHIQSKYNEVHFNVIKDTIEVGILVYGANNNVSYNLLENNGIGVYLLYAKQNMITCNNFIKNEGFFMRALDTPLKWYNWYNRWDKNYWDSLNGTTKVIVGKLKIVLFSWYEWYTYEYHEIAVYPKQINVDWHPALEPYNIP